MVANIVTSCWLNLTVSLGPVCLCLSIVCLEVSFALTVERSVSVYKRMEKEEAFLISLTITPVLSVRAGLGSECRLDVVRQGASYQSFVGVSPTLASTHWLRLCCDCDYAIQVSTFARSWLLFHPLIEKVVYSNVSWGLNKYSN